MSQFLGCGEDPESLVLRYLDDPRPDLKDLILVSYGNLVERVARKYSGLEAHEDLVQVGFIGLLNALSKFNPAEQVRFTTYATYLISGEIKHYLRDRSQTIRHPAWLQELRHRVNKTINALQQQLGRGPTAREIAEVLQVSESAVTEVLQTQDMIKVGSLDSLPTEEDGDSEVDRLDAADFSPEQLSVEDRLTLQAAMRQLRDLERQVLVHFHFDAMNQTEIAAKLGISCNYVSHILRQSLSKLRKILSSDEQRDRLLQRQENSFDYDVVDSVTGVYTDGYFRARIEEEFHRASAQSGALALVRVEIQGLDELRRFYGEESVSDFMADAADFLKSNVRRLDIVCRFGETGFAILLPATGANVHVVRQRITQRIGQWIEQRFSVGRGVIPHIGHAAFPDDAASVAELIARAEPQLIDADGQGPAAETGSVPVAA